MLFCRSTECCSVAQLQLIAKNMDGNNAGTICLSEFVAALANPDLPEEQVQLANVYSPRSGSGPAPIALPEGMEPGASGEHQAVVLTAEQLQGVVVRLTDIKNFTQVWNSYGSMAQLHSATWQGTTHPVKIASGLGVAARNKLRMSIGDYVSSGFENPAMTCCSIDLVDDAKNLTQTSDRLQPIADALMPHPVQYHFVWSQQQVRSCLHVLHRCHRTATACYSNYVIIVSPCSSLQQALSG